MATECLLKIIIFKGSSSPDYLQIHIIFGAADLKPIDHSCVTVQYVCVGITTLKNMTKLPNRLNCMNMKQRL